LITCLYIYIYIYTYIIYVSNKTVIHTVQNIQNNQNIYNIYNIYFQQLKPYKNVESSSIMTAKLNVESVKDYIMFIKCVLTFLATKRTN